MGDVYRAYDREVGIPVALKTMRQPKPADLALIKREFRMLLDVSHPNLVELYGLFADEHDSFFTMELVEGSDLLSWAANGASRAERFGRLLPVLVQLLGGLLALHRRNLVHRDVKPSNVLVTAGGRLVLLDFGLTAGVEGSSFQSSGGGLAGTIAYMAPEQARGARPAPAADLYAVGVMLYEALAGELPFSGNALEILQAKVAGALIPLVARAPDVPPALATLTEALLARRPEDRPDCEAALARLERIVGLQLVDEARLRASLAVPASHELIGRKDELAALDAELEAAVASSRPALVRVAGPAGIGKSALLRRFTDDLRLRGRALVLKSRCHPSESVPFKALDGAIERLRTALDRQPAPLGVAIGSRDADALFRLFPALAGTRGLEAREGTEETFAPASDVRLRGARVFMSVLAALARERPIVLWIDDAQWGDSDSALVLKDVLESTTRAAILVVLSHRPDGGDLIPQLADVPARAVELPALADDEARTLLTGAVQGAPMDPSVATSALAEAAGNPFLLMELGQHLAATDPLEAAASRLDLSSVLAARLRRHPPAARRIFEAVAVAGGPLPRAVALEVADAGQEGRALLAMLLKVKLLRSGRDYQHVQTFHDRLGECLSATLDPDATRALHGRLARALLARGVPDPSVLAFHFARAGEVATASKAAAEAADIAMRALAFERAGRLYELASRLETHAPAERADLLSRWAEAEACAGRAVAAAELHLEAAALFGADRARRSRQAAGQLLIGSGHIDRGLSVLGEVMAAHGIRLQRGRPRVIAQAVLRRFQVRLRGLDFSPRPEALIDPTELDRIDLCWTVAGVLGTLDAAMGLDFQGLHLLLALRAGEPSRVARALAVEASYVSATGRSPQRTAEIERRLARLDPYSRGGSGAAFHDLAEGYRSFLGGKFRAAQLAFERSERLYARLGAVRWERSFCRNHALFTALYLGQWERIRAEVPLLERDYLAAGDRAAASFLALGAGYLACLASDDVEGGRAAVAAARRSWRGEPPLAIRYLAVLAEIELALYVGDPMSAWKRLEDSRDSIAELEGYQNGRIKLAWLRGLISVAATAGLGRSAASRIAARCARRIREERAAWADGLASTLTSCCDLLDGRRERAEEGLAAAAAQHETAGMPAYALAARSLRARVRADPGAAQEQLGMMAGLAISRPERFARLYAPVDVVRG